IGVAKTGVTIDSVFRYTTVSFHYSHAININARNRYHASCLIFKFFAPKCGLRFNFAPLQGAAFIFSCLHSAYCVK
ncbi:hypothetical protein, partial [Citrobacter freundii]|uniref:hypothetical protein n=1 Tax=Citrobacter freundii TaxID=546 RepID=UPI0019535457